MTDKTPPRPPRQPRFDEVRPGYEGNATRPQLSAPPQRGDQRYDGGYAATRPTGQRPMPPQRRHQPPNRRGPGWLGWIAIGLGGAVALAAAVVAYLVVAPPVDLLKRQVIAEVKSRTGRDLTIAGPVAFSVLPSLALSMRDVSLSSPPGIAPSPFLTAREIEARVQLWPLLMRRIGVDRLTLRDPVFTLVADRNGRRNWEFSGAADARPARVLAQLVPHPTGPRDNTRDETRDGIGGFLATDAVNPAATPTGARPAALADLSLADVRIERGTVTYADARTGASHQVSAIDATLAMPAIGGELATTGTLTYGGQPIGFDVKLSSAKALIEQRPARLKLALKAAPIDLVYDGAIALPAGLELDGELRAKGPSLRALAAWHGVELPPADGFGAHLVEGKLKTGAKGFHLSDATIGLDGATAAGTLAVDVTGDRPRLTANLRMSALDLNRYTLAATKATKPVAPAAPVAPRAAPASGAMPPPTGKAPASIEDLIDRAIGGAKVKGYTARDGWSRDPIALDGLKTVDSDLRLSVSQLLWRNIKTGSAIVTVALKAGALRMNVDDIQLYDGRGRAVVTIDSGPAVPTYGLNMTVDGVAAQRFLADAFGVDAVSGIANVQVALGGQGTSEQQIVESLAGKTNLVVANGAINGINVAGAVRSLSRGRWDGLDKALSEKTDFSEMSIGFAIQNGIATSNDLKLQGPLLRMGGAGQISLPARTVDYVARPKLVGSIEGQGGAGNVAGLEIPLRIKGPLAKPEIVPDVDSLAKNPEKAVEAVKEIGRQLKQDGNMQGVKKLLDGLLGR
jgi:AsmA protein